MKHQRECAGIYPVAAQCPSLALEVPRSGAPPLGRRNQLPIGSGDLARDLGPRAHRRLKAAALDRPMIPFVEKESTCATNTIKLT